LDWTPNVVQEVNHDIAGGEWWRKKPYNMGKHGQESSSWQGIMYAADALWNNTG
jgi:hypothetical protein